MQISDSCISLTKTPIYSNANVRRSAHLRGSYPNTRIYLKVSGECFTGSLHCWICTAFNYCHHFSTSCDSPMYCWSFSTCENLKASLQIYQSSLICRYFEHNIVKLLACFPVWIFLRHLLFGWRKLLVLRAFNFSKSGPSAITNYVKDEHSLIFWCFFRILTIWATVSLKMLSLLSQDSKPNNRYCHCLNHGFNELGHPSYGLCTAGYLHYFMSFWPFS